jgi:hypothetical protein
MEHIVVVNLSGDVFLTNLANSRDDDFFSHCRRYFLVNVRLSGVVEIEACSSQSSLGIWITKLSVLTMTV